MRLKRNSELKANQLEQALHRLKKQDCQITELEEELLFVNNNVLNLSSMFGDVKIGDIKKKTELKTVGIDPCFEIRVPNVAKGIQTLPIPIIPNSKNEELISSLREDINQHERQIAIKEANIQEQCRLITDLEKNVETLRLQLIEKENQIRQQTTNSPPTVEPSRQQINIIDEVDLEEHNKLKVCIRF